MTSSRPLVTLITPFHNGAELLGPAIESALAQTYDRWEYVLVDNQSTDGAGAVAERYAQRDPRIRLVRTDTLLPQDLNYSEALRRASPESVYCKFVQADDLLFPRCVEEMVALAEAHPRVGIVGAYYVEGPRVSGGGVPYPTTVLPGRDACRLQLQHGHFLFGSPTTVLLRTAMVRETTPYYDPNVFHSDTEACYRDLERWDFGFVHQVLSLMRIDNPGRMTRVRTYYPYALDKFIVVTKYGRKYLSPAEFAQVDAFSRSGYFRLLGQAYFTRRNPDFWRYHREGLATIGYQLRWYRLWRYLALALIDLIGNPKMTLGRMVRALRGQVPDR